MPTPPRPTPTPFYDSTGRSPGATRRILLLSPHFPPGAAAGALRWQKLARHACERGFGLDAVAFDPAALERRDEGRLADLPADVRAFGVPPRRLAIERLEKAALAALRPLRRGARAGGAEASGPGPARAPASASAGPGWHPRQVLRAYDAAMDYAREGSWAADAARVALRVFDPSRHCVVVSCGPPHMAAHEAGRRVAEHTRRPFVVDMRDPWRLVDRLAEGLESPTWRRLAARYERRVIALADLVVMNTVLARDAMRRLYPERAERIIAVLNGWDEDPLPVAKPDPRFLVAFVGTIYLDRDPRPFFRAAGRVVRELGLAPEEFGIEFLGDVGDVGGSSTTALAASEGLDRHFRARPPAPHREALELMARATLLVNLPQSLPMAIPSKVYEYMRFPAWVLCLSEPGDSPAWLLGAAGGDVVDREDAEGIARVLRTRVEEHRRGVRPEPLARDARFSRRAQAARLFDAIDGLLASSGRGRSRS